MPHYMIQAKYNQDQIKAMVDNPQDRAEAARKLIEGFGGKMECFYFTFADSDIVAIGELPDNETALAGASWLFVNIVRFILGRCAITVHLYDHGGVILDRWTADPFLEPRVPLIRRFHERQGGKLVERDATSLRFP